MTSFGNIYPHEAQCPVVDETDNGYRIYYGRRANGKSYISYFEVDKDMRVVYDHLSPIVRLGQEGAFDEHGQIPSSIATIDGAKMLYFTGVSTRSENSYKNAIGMIRVEEEGFFKLREPIIEARHNQWFTSHLMVSGNNGYYCSCRTWRNGEPIYDIEMADTKDGIEWTERGDVLYLKKGEGGLCSFNVIEDKAIFCARDREDYRGGYGSYRIETAEWHFEGWKRTGRLELPKEGWNDQMQCYPYVVNNLMFYNGNDFGKTGIGCVELSS